MKKIFNIAFAIALVLLSNSCQRDLTIYNYEDGCAGATFATAKKSFTMVEEDGNKIVIELQRGNIKGNASVSFEMEDLTEGVFVPEKNTFDFKDGENTASVTFNYPDIKAFLGEIYTFNLTIDSKQASLTGKSTLAVSAQRQLQKVKLCNVTIEDPVWDASGPWDAELYNTVEAADLFYIPGMYSEGYDVAFTAKDGVFTLIEPLIDLGEEYDSDYGNYCFMVENTSFDKEKNCIVFSGYLTLANLPTYQFCAQEAYITVPEDFDVKKYFGVQ